jgi:MoaA/NifB/PqqE/SkfB family radical SAM enzyme
MMPKSNLKQEKMKFSRIDLAKYVTIPVWYGCNNDCLICMLSGLRRDLPFIDFELFKRLVIHTKEKLKCENLILSGGEMTVFDELEKYSLFAASLGWFKKIQIQTNGRRLSDEKYLKRLIECGINEFFISIHGLEESHDAMTRKSGSFRETSEGIHNLEAYNVNVLTNTVLTKLNYREVIPLLANLSRGTVSEIHLWNFFPMETRDRKDLLVSMNDCRKLLHQVIPILENHHKPLTLKNFPECLCFGEHVFLDNSFPVTYIGETYWRAFEENRFGLCAHRNTCHAQECWGLTNAHVEKYGDERNLLSPIV